MAFDLASNYRTDNSKEEDGVWEWYGDGVGFKVARAGNSVWDKEIKKYPKVTRQAFSDGNLSEEQAAEVLCHLMSVAILLDWKGITNDGKPVEYSQENAKKFLKEYPDFRTEILKIAGERKRYLDDTVAENEGN